MRVLSCTAPSWGHDQLGLLSQACKPSASHVGAWCCCLLSPALWSCETPSPSSLHPASPCSWWAGWLPASLLGACSSAAGPAAGSTCNTGRLYYIRCHYNIYWQLYQSQSIGAVLLLPKHFISKCRFLVINKVSG